MSALNLHFCITIAARNVEKFVSKCLTSACKQNYKNFSIIFVDAKSTDETLEIAKYFEKKYANLKVYENDERKFQVENHLFAIHRAPYDSVIVNLDGDDWFPNHDVLSYLAQVYEKNKCWMTYGTYVENPFRDVSTFYHEYPVEIKNKNNFRDYKWLASHLRTFKRELFLKIDVNSLKDPRTKQYFKVSGDCAFQFPMLEMCGERKSVYLPEILYVYNTANPENDFKVDLAEQEKTAQIIREMPRYSALESLMPPSAEVENPTLFMGILSSRFTKDRRLIQLKKNINFEHKYFVGDPNLDIPCVKGDIVYLPCNDDYESLPLKVHEMFKWILSFRAVDYIVKTDDDIVIDGDVVTAIYKRIKSKQISYAGEVVSCSAHFSEYHIGKCKSFYNKIPIELKDCTYCSGGGYFLSKEATQIVLESGELLLNKYLYEDYSVGKILNENNIYPQNVNPRAKALVW